MTTAVEVDDAHRSGGAALAAGAPTSYGGTEAVVDNLARGLRDLGHEVRLFTVGESTSPVPRGFLYHTAVRPMGDCVLEAAHVLAAYRDLRHMDLIHDHTLLGSLIVGRHFATLSPVVVTNHGQYTAPRLGN